MDQTMMKSLIELIQNDNFRKNIGMLTPHQNRSMAPEVTAGQGFFDRVWSFGSTLERCHNGQGNCGLGRTINVMSSVIQQSQPFNELQFFPSPLKL
jgi:hypothetical protein